MTRRLRAAGDRQAEERDQLIVDRLVEAAHADDVSAVKRVVEAHGQEPAALDAQVFAGQRCERPLGRQPRTDGRRGQELFGARREHALLHTRRDVRVLVERREHDAEPRAQQGPLREVVVVRVAAAVFDGHDPRRRPTIAAVHLADRPAVVGAAIERQRPKRPGLVLLRAV